MKTRYFLLLFAFGLYTIGYPQSKTDKEIESLQDQISTLQDQNFKLKDDILELQNIKNSNDLVQKEIQFIKNGEDSFYKRINFWVVFASIFIAIFSLFGIYNISDLNRTHKNIIKNIQQEFNLKIQQEFEKIKKGSIKYINTMLNDEAWMRDIMGKANIILVNPDQNDDLDVEKVLNYFDTSDDNKTEILFNEVDKLIEFVKGKKSKDKLDLVLLENSNGTWDPSGGDRDNALKIAEDLFDLGVHLFYFGPSEKHFPSRGADYTVGDDKSHKIIHNISFANAPSKLYFSVLEALKYMDIIKIEKD